MQKLVVLGGGESGVGAAILGKVKGFDVLVSDSGKLRDDRRAELDSEGIRHEDGGHTLTDVLAADLVVKSPGIPDDAPLIVELRQKGIPVISEIEFAGRYTKSRTIGITGANGKTTTTLLTHHLLTQAGYSASLAGNVGFSLARQVAKGNEPDWYVIELSSFQLDGMTDFRCDVAILCNITPDHMDRYDHNFGNYARSKYRITQNMTADNSFIYNADDMGTLDYFNHPAASCIPVSTLRRSSMVCTENGVMSFDVAGKKFTLDVASLPIKGLHNTYNAMQAITAALVVGLSSNQVVEGLRTFRNAPHRLELVRTLNGVDYVNDSKATNVDAAWYALECQTRPVVWIAGGKDKGNDYTAIEEIARKKVKALVCMGKDNKKLVDFFGDKLPKVIDTHSLDECVAQCHRLAEPGDVVLLSPCCASFDLFTSYENRGDLFRDAVAKL